MRGEQAVVGSTSNETFVFFGAPDALVGVPLSEGHPDPAVLGDVRHFLGVLSAS